MDRLKKARTPLRARLTRLVNQTTPLLQDANPDKDILQANLEVLEEIWVALEEMDQKVMDQLLDDDEDESDIELESASCEPYQMTYVTMKNGIKKLVEPATPPESVYSEAVGSIPAREARKRKIKLPEVKMMQFDGELKNWLAWWSQFRKIHELTSEEMDDSDKYVYLRDAMTEGTEAYQIVASHFQSMENYKQAIEALQERYGRDDLQLQVYVRELLSLVISNVTQKEKMPLPTLQLKLQSHLRCLSTLKLDQADPATWLFPLVESSLSEETLRAWQRSAFSKLDGQSMTPKKTRLDLLMDFITGEVRTEQQISMAQNAFQSAAISDSKQKGKGKSTAAVKRTQDIATAAGLISGQVVCAFCDGKHESERCFKAQDMSLEEKQEKVKGKNLCYRCLEPFHPKIKRCRIPLRCFLCKGPHQTIMCRGKVSPEKNKSTVQQQEFSGNQKDAAHRSTSSDNMTTSSSTASVCSSDVLLNIIQVKVTGEKGSTTVRLMGDTGSQRSYVCQEVVKKVGLKQIGHEYIQNVLFGGATTQPIYSGKYVAGLSKLNGTGMNDLELLGRPQICGAMSRVPQGPWIAELREKGIQLTDVGEGCANVDILIGSDYWGTLLTGKMMKLQCGLLAVETIFGWTISGRVPVTSSSLAATVTSSLLSTTYDLSQLWSLEAIGIRDPIEVQSKEQEEQHALTHFNENVKLEGGAYVVALPWKVDQSSLPTNKFVAEKRLQRATQKLRKQDKFEVYDEVFRGWEREGLIREVHDPDNEGHFLPHRPVFKESLTTPVRPVFDASCKVGNHPSLNDCLYKGPNLLELIPSLLLRFREDEIGVSSDIRKAFQMLHVREEDQKYQKFLWWKDASCKEMKIYQHQRVVFGINCSPFLLAATIQHHLMQKENSALIEKLKISWYADNLVTSVHTLPEFEKLKTESISIMEKAGMELREWAHTLGDESGAGSSTDDGCRLDSAEKGVKEDDITMSVLGLQWNRQEDSLSCVIPEVDLDEKFTKKKILSLVARIFDPIGFLAPVLVPLKALIQDSWSEQYGWDELLPEEYQKKMSKWIRSIHLLTLVKLPRHFQLSQITEREVHIFVDASSTAYAGVVFMRSTLAGVVKVQLLLAKSRLAPRKLLPSSNEEADEKPTIPRLELMGCVIGVRLANTVKEGLNLDVHFHYWSDSSTSLAWIRRHDHWGAFVGNRVAEILKSTTSAQWKHVPGIMNPADLPSRGCNPVELLQSTWWEGPSWLKEDKSFWPNSEEEIDENAVNLERRKTAVLIAIPVPPPRFSSYRKNVAVWGWVRRFISNCRKSPLQLLNKDRHLTLKEMRLAEKTLIRNVQQESFPEAQKKIGGMTLVRDAEGFLCVQTRLLNRKDSPGFLYPVLLPKDHPIVELLILDIHKFYGHAGVQFIMSKSREKYWILQTRRTIRRVLRKCTTCRRHEAKPLEVVPAALPEKRVSGGEPFEATGVDLFGPLFLEDGSKVWVVIFTCALFRCIYLDPIKSLSTEAFLGALERFISLYGRPNTVYSDNGTNFHGAVNVFRSLDWQEIEEKCQVRQIQWIFNPPTAAWWGGFWERLIRSVKDLLKRILRTSRLEYDDLRTCLAGVCATINERPLTAVTEDGSDLIPLTPGMFLRRRTGAVMPETVNSNSLKESYLRMKAFQQQLQERFRKEYLSLLVQRGNQPKRDGISEGAIVLVGAENKKRYQWPLGLVLELIRGPDGETRTAKVKTSHGVLVRPLQRLYPLEVNCENVEDLKKAYLQVKSSIHPRKRKPEVKVPVERVVVTKRGRIIRTPARYGQWYN